MKETNCRQMNYQDFEGRVELLEADGAFQRL